MTDNIDQPNDNIDMNEYGSIEKDAPIDKYVYYLVGDRPLRIGYVGASIAVIAEVLNLENKEFEIDNFYISYVAKSTEVVELSKKEFLDACLKRGAKPPL